MEAGQLATNCVRTEEGCKYNRACEVKCLRVKRETEESCSLAMIDQSSNVQKEVQRLRGSAATDNAAEDGRVLGI